MADDGDYNSDDISDEQVLLQNSGSRSTDGKKISGEHKRLRGTSVAKPIVYGSIAYLLPEKNEVGHTHKWIVYVRSPDNEDMSYFVKKVQFTLHQSFQNPKRNFDVPPYEVTETGWGEFEVQIRLHFYDASEKAVDLFHPLRLFRPDHTSGTIDAPLVTEFYDEIVFNEPTEALYKRLQETGDQLPKSQFHKFLTKFDEHQELKKIVLAHKKVKLELQHLRERYDTLEQDSVELKKQIVMKNK